MSRICRWPLTNPDAMSSLEFCVVLGIRYRGAGDFSPICGVWHYGWSLATTLQGNAFCQVHFFEHSLFWFFLTTHCLRRPLSSPSDPYLQHPFQQMLDLSKIPLQRTFFCVGPVCLRSGVGLMVCACVLRVCTSMCAWYCIVCFCCT